MVCTLSLVATPLAVSYVFNRLIMLSISYPTLANNLVKLYSPLAWIFLIFWVWVGSRFAKIELKRIYSFLIGNSLNIIACFVYIWLFYWSDPATRLAYSRLSTLSEFYTLPVISLSFKIVATFVNYIDGRVTQVVSFLLLTLAFSIGFIYQYWKDNR